jgi:oligosaccharide translocation protein RFT1
MPAPSTTPRKIDETAPTTAATTTTRRRRTTTTTKTPTLTTSAAPVPEPVPATAAASEQESASRAAARGTLFTLVLRIVSFLCTQLTIRALDPSTLGKAAVRLELLLTTVLFLSREGFRLALTQRVTSGNWIVAWLTVPVVTLVAGSAWIWHLSLTTYGGGAEDDDDRADFHHAGTLYCLASWVEGCAEPAVLYFLRRLEVSQRASAEGVATVAKAVATVAVLRFSPSHRWHVTALGSAQVVYASTYALYLYGRASSRPDFVRPGLPGGARAGTQLFRLWREQPDVRDACYTSFVFTLQGILKHVLTEADKIVLTTMANSYDQGVYAMGASYGGMAARILLQPLEENARLLWSRLAATETTTTTSGGGRPDDNAGTTGPDLRESYTTLVKLVVYIGLVFSCIAVHYTNLLLCLLAGRTWGKNVEAANVLAAFCVYTAFLALNGMTEALVYAVGGGGARSSSNTNSTTTVEMAKLGMVHTLTGVAFAGSASVLVSRYGTIGLVGANCVAMSIRSLYSLYFAARYFSAGGSPLSCPRPTPSSTFLQLLSQIIPHPAVLTGFVAAWVATGWSLRTLSEHGHQLLLDIRNRDWLLLTGQHLAVGVSCALGTASLAIALERPFLRSLSGMVGRGGGRASGEAHSQETSSERPKED